MEPQTTQPNTPEHHDHKILYAVIGVFLLIVIAGSVAWWQTMRETQSTSNICIEGTLPEDCRDTVITEDKKGTHGLSLQIESHPTFLSWYESKQKIYGTIANFKIYLTSPKIGMTRDEVYDGGIVCQGESEKSVASPDGNRIACITNVPIIEPDSDLLLYDKVNKVSGRLQSCGTPCKFEDGFWLDNDRFIFLSEYEDLEFAENYQNYIVVQQFDFKNNRSDSWSARVTK